MRILLLDGKPVQEIGYIEHEKVVFLRYLREEDKPKCECGRVIEKDIDILEGCLNWKERVREVETIPNTKSV